MAVESPRPIEALDERLASLEDATLKARLLSENPSLYAEALARLDRQARIRTWWIASLAATAIASMLAGLLISPMISKWAQPARAPRQTIATEPPPRSRALPQVQAKPRPRPAAHPAVTVVVPKRSSAGEAARARAAQQAELRRLEARAAAEEAAAQQAQTQARAAAAAASRALPKAHAKAVQQTAAAGQGAAVSQAPVQASTNVSNPAPGPDMPLPSGAKGLPGGGWTEHYPGGLQHGGVVLGGQDPCTPSGGRIGIVLQSIMR